MPFATVNSISLHYEVIGSSGPWLALVSGARRSLDEVKGLAVRVAADGFRVLLHDRRNTGQSSLSLDGEGSEFEIWADDLLALKESLGLPPLIVGGSSSGCRLATIMALRHHNAIRALVMMRVTGGAFAVKRLSNVYYTQYIEAAERGGMSAVSETDHFKDLITADPARRKIIQDWDVAQFIATMKRWRDGLEAGINDPMLGANERALRAISFPVCVMPGNDKTHSLAAGRTVHGMIPNAEMHELRSDQLDDDLIPLSEWATDSKIAAVVSAFCRRVSQDAEGKQDE